MTNSGWLCSHHHYGEWFISRKAVTEDWLHDHKQAYPDEPIREPNDEEIETWFNEQTSWIEITANGYQTKKPDMVEIERIWMECAKQDPDYPEKVRRV